MVFVLFFALVAWGLVNLYVARRQASERAGILQSELNEEKTKNQNLASQLQYYSSDNNLVKELKEQTSYKNPGEKVIILVPGATSTTSTTSTQ